MSRPAVHAKQKNVLPSSSIYLRRPDCANYATSPPIFVQVDSIEVRFGTLELKENEYLRFLAVELWIYANYVDRKYAVITLDIVQFSRHFSFVLLFSFLDTFFVNKILPIRSTNSNHSLLFRVVSCCPSSCRVNYR